jgi:hypothetical protein
MNLVAALLDEIERVAAKRERWKAFAAEAKPYSRFNAASFAPTIFLMTAAIDNAKKAIAEQDVVLCITCLKALKEFDSDD